MVQFAACTWRHHAFIQQEVAALLPSACAAFNSTIPPVGTRVVYRQTRAQHVRTSDPSLAELLNTKRTDSKDDGSEEALAAEVLPEDVQRSLCLVQVLELLTIWWLFEDFSLQRTCTRHAWAWRMTCHDLKWPDSAHFTAAGSWLSRHCGEGLRSGGIKL